ncbi:MAG: glucose-1-phosphate cytidylyltransferase [Chloroflexi bacterium]|nr:glucose-1-phosphate cytidylyltransferase [Chloroflexota bacterium]
MKVAILAGGLGTRLSEETTIKPKPMVEIGGKPILWHIMKTYSSFGFKEFVVALGYKGEMIKDYFLNYHHYSHNLTVQIETGAVTIHKRESEDWTIHLLDTGYETQTGGRVKQVAEFVGDEPFMLTYGDGVSNVNIAELLDFHRRHGKLATLTAVRPPARFGQLIFDGDQINRFEEKPQVGEGWINGGFFVLQPEIVRYVDGNSTYWEREPLERLSADNQLAAYRHADFWQCMDTLRDKKMLEGLWQDGVAPWKVWE